MSVARKVYDRAYFDRWYRDPRHVIDQPDLLARRVQLAVAAAEYVLERPVRTVLDVGCGEGRWRAWLKRARPRIRYEGVDSSRYVVERYGARRGIRLGSFGGLGRLGLRGPYDLIVCADVLHYVGDREARAGLGALSRLLGGVAYVEVYAREDDTVGDDVGYQPRSANTYRRLFTNAGLVHLGLHCWVGRDRWDDLMTFERGLPPAPRS